MLYKGSRQRFWQRSGGQIGFVWAYMKGLGSGPGNGLGNGPGNPSYASGNGPGNGFGWGQMGFVWVYMKGLPSPSYPQSVFSYRLV